MTQYCIDDLQDEIFNAINRAVYIFSSVGILKMDLLNILLHSTVTESKSNH